MVKPVIKLENLSVVYSLGKSNETQALKDVNLEIYPQEYIIFFGPSGCGKSTLLYAIAGLEKPTQGKVTVKDRDLNALSEKELIDYHQSSVGMVFQAYYLVSSLSVLDNVLLPSIFKGNQDKKAIREQASLLLQRFQVEDQAKKFPNALSGGQQQRVAISRALINNPSIILADEPVGNLDSTSAQNVVAILKQLNEQDKRTVILVTHDPRYLNFAHRVYYIEDGRITQEIVNTDKIQIIQKERTPRVASPLEQMARIYPYLPKTLLQAKALANYFIYALSFDEQARLEEILEKYIKNEISQSQLENLLDLPYAQGGVGLYHQTARAFTQKVQEILGQARILKQEMERFPREPEKTQIKQRVEDLRIFLLDDYSGQLNLNQIQHLEKAIEGQLLGSIDRKLFQDYLDRPEKKGGVGLNKATAKKFAKKLEVVLSETG
jgi:putative ABC transport system ATP-binding protein